MWIVRNWYSFEQLVFQYISCPLLIVHHPIIHIPCDEGYIRVQKFIYDQSIVRLFQRISKLSMVRS